MQFISIAKFASYYMNKNEDAKNARETARLAWCVDGKHDSST